MDEFVVLDVPDVTGMTMLELMSCQDPQLLAAAQRLMARVLAVAPGDEVEVTMWGETNVTPHVCGVTACDRKFR